MGHFDSSIGPDPHVWMLTTTSTRGVEVVITGELDAATAPAVRAGLDPHLTAGPSRLVIDLRGVDFMDCSGLSVLIKAAQRMHAVGGVVTLRSPGRAVRRLLDLCDVALVPGISIDDPAASHPARLRLHHLPHERHPPAATPAHVCDA